MTDEIPSPPPAGADRAAFWRDMRIVIILGGGYLLSGFYLLSLPPVFPILKAEFDTSYAALGAVMTAFGLATSASQIPFGILVDRIGAYRVLIVGHCFLSFGVVLAGFTSSYLGLLACFIVAGIGHGVFQPADFAIMSTRIAPHRMGRAFSVHSSLGYVGFVLAPGTMIVLAAQFGWRFALVVTGIVGLIVLLALIHWRRDFVEQAPAAAKGATAGTAASGLRGFLVLLSPTMIFFLVFYIFTLSAGSGIRNFSVTAITMISETPLALANAALTGFYMASAIGTLAGGWVADRTHRHDMAVSGAMAIATTGFFALGALPLPALGMAFVLTLNGFLHGFIRPPRDLMIRAATPAGALGKVFASVSTLGQVVSSVVPFFLGWLIDIGEPRWVIWVITLMLGSTVVMMLTGRKIAMPRR